MWSGGSNAQNWLLIYAQGEKPSITKFKLLNLKHSLFVQKLNFMTLKALSIIDSNLRKFSWLTWFSILLDFLSVLICCFLQSFSGMNLLLLAGGSSSEVSSEVSS